MKRILKYKYFVGIDFGDGETTVSCFHLNPEEKFEKIKPEPLNILKSTDPRCKKLESAIVFKNGSWVLPSNYVDFANSHLEQHFKLIPSDYNYKEDKLEALLEFVEVVFNFIIENNKPKLEYNKASKSKNFFLCIACPSKWYKISSSAPAEYKQLIQSRIPVDAIIKESDAAFFHFLKTKQFNSTNTRYLVIDYGSSTIDYTYCHIKDDGMRPECDGSLGVECGASEVERAWRRDISKVCQNYNKYLSALKAFNRQIYGDDRLRYLKFENEIDHYLKQKKEEYYGRTGSDGSRIDCTWSTKLRRNTTDYFDEIEDNALFVKTYNSADIENEVLRNYKKTVADDFERVIQANQWYPDVIMITGGAAQMGWVQPLVYDIFKKYTPNVAVHTDTSTNSYIVSHGISYYMSSLCNYMINFPKKKKHIEDTLCTESVIQSILVDSIQSTIRKYVYDRIKSICNDFKTAPSTLRHLCDTITSYGQNIGQQWTDSEISKLNIEISNAINKAIKGRIDKELNDSFKGSFNLDLYLPSKLDFNSIINRSFYININADRYIREAAKSVVCLSWEDESDINFSKARNEANDRQRIADNLLRIIEDKLAHMKVSGNSASTEVKRIQDAINEYLKIAEHKWPFDIF